MMVVCLIPLGHHLHVATHTLSQATPMGNFCANCEVQAHLVVIIQQKGKHKQD